MCANCGCGIPEDKHGDERNITWPQIEAAAAANDQSTDEAVNNIEKMPSMSMSMSTERHAQYRLTRQDRTGRLHAVRSRRAV
jgi:hypothetical protein